MTAPVGAPNGSSNNSLFFEESHNENNEEEEPQPLLRSGNIAAESIAESVRITIPREDHVSRSTLNRLLSRLSTSIRENLSVDASTSVRVCVYECEDANPRSRIAVGYVNSSAQSDFEAWNEGYRISEILCGQPVTVIYNNQGLCRCRLPFPFLRREVERIPRTNPIVLALIEAWSAFFLQCRARDISPRGYVQYCYGDGVAYVEAALKSTECQGFAHLIRVVAIGPTVYCDPSLNVHHYRAPGDWFSLIDVRGFINARSSGSVTTLAYSPELSSTIPRVWDATYVCVLRTEYTRVLRGEGSNPGVNVIAHYNPREHSINMQLIVLVDEEDEFTARVVLRNNAHRTDIVEEYNHYPLTRTERVVSSLLGVTRIVNLMNTFALAGRPVLDDYLCYFTITGYTLGGMGEIVLWVTNRPGRPQRWRLLRVLSRYMIAFADFVTWFEAFDCLRTYIEYYYGVNPTDYCTRGNVLSTLIPLYIMGTGDLMLLALPRLHHGVSRALLRLVAPQTFLREEQANREVIRTARGRRYRFQFSTRQAAALGAAAALFDLLINRALLQFTFMGLDFYSLRIPSRCRVRCENVTEIFDETQNSDRSPTIPSGTITAITGGIVSATTQTVSSTVATVSDGVSAVTNAVSQGVSAVTSAMQALSSIVENVTQSVLDATQEPIINATLSATTENSLETHAVTSIAENIVQNATTLVNNAARSAGYAVSNATQATITLVQESLISNMTNPSSLERRENSSMICRVEGIYDHVNITGNLVEDLDSRSVLSITRTIREIWCFCFLLYYTYLIIRIINDRRRR